jgi:hypothetical protein
MVSGQAIPLKHLKALPAGEPDVADEAVATAGTQGLSWSVPFLNFRKSGYDLHIEDCSTNIY